MSGLSDAERELTTEMAACAADPVRFVRFAFAWGQGDLANHPGPEAWQLEVLEAVRDGLVSADQAIRIAACSGHGVGKSALVAWLILWSLATFEDARGIVTANTETQLKTKTWVELAKWHNRSIIKHWFHRTATAIYSADPAHERTWRIDMIAWSEHNSEAFAGLHNAGKRLLLIFDEASAIANEIWEVAEGALTDADTQIIWCAFGNGTRAVGRFRECFRKYRKYWLCWRVDARQVRFTNKAQIAQWIEAYGEDSDFVTTRVKGAFPKQSAAQFIGTDLVDAAATREPKSYPQDPLVFGVDVARYGDDASMIWFRRGRDAASLKPLSYRGRSTMHLAGEIARLANELHPDAIFIDGGGVGGGVVDRCTDLGVDVIEVNFGGAPGDRAYLNKRAEMYGIARTWLETGAIPDDRDLKEELTTMDYAYAGGRGGEARIVLEKKQDFKTRLGRSPDAADAFVLTFAHPVVSARFGLHRPDAMPGTMAHDFDPLDQQTQ